jgi:hypothetical protein
MTSARSRLRHRARVPRSIAIRPRARAIRRPNAIATNRNERIEIRPRPARVARRGPRGRDPPPRANLSTRYSTRARSRLGSARVRRRARSAARGAFGAFARAGATRRSDIRRYPHAYAHSVRHDVGFGGRYFFTTRARTHGSESISNATIGRDRTRDRTSSAPSRARVAPHSFTHTFAMLAQKFTVSAKAVATTKHTVAKRGNSIVRRNSKGGEEGAVRPRRRRRRDAR